VADSLRDRKKERTRRALVEVSTELFHARGYEATTIADIAAAADIGTRTFFSYFATKEDLLFAFGDGRVQTALRAIETRQPGEQPAQVLLRALQDTGRDDDDMVSRLADLRLHLIRTVPAVRAKALAVQFDAQREIARQVHRAFPAELTEVTAAALVGAFVGAVTASLEVILEQADGKDPEALKRELQAATGSALAPWIR
jgi:AcrR family transcriptional regulator